MAANAYSSLDQWLHRVALSPLVTDLTFDLEQLWFGRDLPESKEGRHVFVCGLARAGTTVLMRELYATGQFGSLTYRDMPFILAPNLWRKLWQRGAKANESSTRAHDDGLEHGFDSPEALEEVFWRHHAGDAYLHRDHLSPMAADDETIDAFRTYVGLILKATGKTRYLSKNNNSILRLGSLAKAFPNATILVPFRDPLQHANSLLNQHRRFLDIHHDDPFALQYMTWLGHHEFGADHRPFHFSDEPLPADPLTLDYWLALWCQTYRYLLEHLPANARFVSYEALCTDTERVWGSLAEHLGLPDQATPHDLLLAQKSELPAAHESSKERASKLFTELRQTCL